MEKFAPSQNPPPPQPKPEDITIQDFRFDMAEDNGYKILAIGSDERVYFYNPVSHSWFLL